MYQINNVNLAKKGADLEKGEKAENLLQGVMIVLVVVIPWLFFLAANSLELLKQSFLFSFVALMVGIGFFGLIRRSEIFWKKNFLNGLVLLFLVFQGILFLYSKNHQISWEGYQGSFTSGISEYLAFVLFYFLGVQFFSKVSWKQNLELFLFSISASFIFLILMAYFGKNEFLSANFSRTPSLIAATCGVTAMAFWWMIRSKEKIMDWINLFSALVLFFVSSVLDYSLSWWVWVVGIGMIILFDFIYKTKEEKARETQRQLNMPLEKGGSFIRKITGGKGKYLFFLFLFSFSQAISPLILRTEKVEIMPYYSILSHYPILLDKILLYLLLEIFVVVFALFVFLRGKTEKSLSLAIAGSLSGIITGQLIYYSESTLLYFLIWAILILASLSFLRRKKELDFLKKIESSQGKTALTVALVAAFVLVVLLLVLRIKSLF